MMTQVKRRSAYGLRSGPLLLVLAAVIAGGGCRGDRKTFNSSGTGTVVLTFHGAITGKVIVRATGQAVKGALVTTSADGALRQTITDAGGNYSFAALPYLSDQSTTYDITIDLRSDATRTVTPGTDTTPTTTLTEFAYTSATFNAKALLSDPQTFTAGSGATSSLTVGDVGAGQPTVFQDNLHIAAPVAAVRRVGASARGTIVNENGQPLTGVLVSAHEKVSATGPDNGVNGPFGSVNGIEHSMAVAAVTTDANGNYTLTNLPEEDEYALHIDGTAIGFRGFVDPSQGEIEIGLAGLTTTVGSITLSPDGTDHTSPSLVQVAGAQASLFGLSSKLDLNEPITFTFNEPMKTVFTSGGPDVVLVLDSNGNGVAESFETKFDGVHQAVPGTNGKQWTFLMTKASGTTPGQVPPSGAGVNSNTPPLLLSLRDFEDLSGNFLTAASSGLTGADDNPGLDAGSTSWVEVAFSTEAVEPSATAKIGMEGIPAGNTADTVVNDALIKFDNLAGPMVFTFDTPMLSRTGGTMVDPSGADTKVNIARDSNQNGVWDSSDSQIGGTLKLKAVEILGTAGVLSDREFSVSGFSLPADQGTQPISQNPDTFAPGKEKIVIQIDGAYDASGNLWQGKGLGSGIVVDPVSGAPNIVLRTTSDPTLLAASNIAVGPDAATQVTFLPSNAAAVVSQLNQSNSLDADGELELMAPFYTNPQVNPTVTTTPLTPIALNTKFGPLPTGSPAITQHVDRVLITFDDPSGAAATATQYELLLGTTSANIGSTAPATLLNNTTVSGTRQFLLNLGDVTINGNAAVDNIPFDDAGDAGKLFAKIRTTNQFGRTGDSAMFEIADKTAPNVRAQSTVAGARTGIASPTTGRPASATLKFDLFAGDLDTDALTPASTPTFLPIVEVTGPTGADLTAALTLLDDRSGPYDTRRASAGGTYTPADFTAAGTPAVDGTTDFTADTTVEFNETLSTAISTYFGFLGDLAYTGNTQALKGDVSSPAAIKVQLANPFAARTGDTLSFPNVQDQAGNKVGAGAKAVIRDVTPPMLTGAKVEVNASRLGTITLTFNKDVWAAPATDLNSAFNPAVYAIGDGTQTLTLSSTTVNIGVSGSTVTIGEKTKGSAGIPFEQITADWTVLAKPNDALNRAHNDGTIGLDLGPNLTSSTGDLVPPVILTGATAVTSTGGTLLPGNPSATTSPVTITFEISEDGINHSNAAVGVIPASETCVNGVLTGTPPAGSYNARVKTAIQPLLTLFNSSGLSATMTRTNEDISGTSGPNTLTITVTGKMLAVPVAGTLLDLKATGFQDAAGNTAPTTGAKLVLTTSGLVVQ